MTKQEAMHIVPEENQLEAEKMMAFEESQEVMAKIAEVGFVKHVEGLPNLPDAFDLEKHKPQEDCQRCVCCMDGRTSFGVHAAGSGILLSETELDKYLEKSGADSISSHDGCGAAKLAAIAYTKKTGIPVENTDDFGRKWVEQKANEKGLKHIHLGVDKEFHYERVCYYDGTGKFNYEGVEGLPAGFNVGRAYMSKESSLAEVEVAISIAFDHHHHGFGERFTEENPFVLVAIAGTQEELEKKKAELAGLAGNFGKKVRVDGFICPK